MNKSFFVSIRRVAQEGKTELQRALEKRKWEQKMKASRDQEEAKKKMSPLPKELMKKHQKLEQVYVIFLIYFFTNILITSVCVSALIIIVDSK